MPLVCLDKSSSSRLNGFADHLHCSAEQDPQSRDWGPLPCVCRMSLFCRVKPWGRTANCCPNTAHHAQCTMNTFLCGAKHKRPSIVIWFWIKKYIEIIVLVSEAAPGRAKALAAFLPSQGSSRSVRSRQPRSPQNRGKPWHGETAMSKQGSSSRSWEALLCFAGRFPFPLCSSHGQASPAEPSELNFWFNTSFGSSCCQIGRVGSGGYGWDAAAARKPLFTAHSGRKRAQIPRKLFCVPEQPRCRGGEGGGAFPKASGLRGSSTDTHTDTHTGCSPRCPAALGCALPGTAAHWAPGWVGARPTPVSAPGVPARDAATHTKAGGKKATCPSDKLSGGTGCLPSLLPPPICPCPSVEVTWPRFWN